MKLNLSKPYKSHNKGFALIAVISLVVLLALVAVALLTLGNVNTRSNSNSEIENAKENAKLSLMIALGELQEKAGHDTRITAPATAIATVSDPLDLAETIPVTGVWRSWEGTDHDASGVPEPPLYSEKLTTGDLDISSSSNGRFLGWLVSGSEANNDADSPPDLTTGSVNLLNFETIDPITSNSVSNEVRVDPTNLDNNGSYAWWIQGENTKALIRKPETSPSTDIDWAKRLSTGTYSDITSFALNPSDSKLLETFPSLETIDFIDQDFAETNFNDATHYSRGLLTNSATGGWRKDLSIMTEEFANITNKEFFTLEPGNELDYSSGEFIYHWNQLTDFLDDNANNRPAAASSSWEALANYTQKYKDAVSGVNEVKTTFDPTASTDFGVSDRDLRPILHSITWVLSFTAEQLGTSNSYNPQLNLLPVLTYWNPYNTTIQGLGDFQLRNTNPIPTNFRFTIGSRVVEGSLTLDRIISFRTNLRYNFSDSAPWAPGENRIYTGSNVLNSGISTMTSGYKRDAGGTVEITPRNVVAADGSDLVTIEVLANSDTARLGLLQQNSTTMQDFNTAYEISASDTENMWENAIDNSKINSFTVAQSATSPQAFFIASLRLKSPATPTINPSSNLMRSRGYADNKALFTRLANIEPGGNLATQNPESLPYEWVLETLNGSNSPILPQAPSQTATNTYIGTSPESTLGMEKLIISEIPSRAIHSLGDLQHFDIAYSNPLPPYPSNPIGNSSASYLIEPDSIAVGGNTGANTFSFDHSYLANHLLYDDWFVSSLTSQSVAAVNLQPSYNQFLEGLTPLENDMYVPAEVTSSPEPYNTQETWRNFASEIEVEGMFNVNSTSVNAWKAMLKKLRDASVPQINDATNSLDTRIDETPVPRLTVSTIADSEISSDSTIAALGSHAWLTDNQINALAEEIVTQVKRRGPFLSLSEFLNRQLSLDDDLAKSGAIESALNELVGKAQSENPYFDFVNLFTEAASSNPAGSNAHAFPLAADGSVVYGYPGWIRQADIIRPLAPVLSVRDDTFRIRAYGSKGGAEAWCEAIVQRKADYVDPADENTIAPSDTTLTSDINKALGRKFKIISFRWLSEEEI